VELPGPDEAAAAALCARARRVLRPPRALRRLEEAAAWLAAWQGTSRPALRDPAALVFVADHGVADEGVSAYPRSTTAAMLGALRAGVATACVLARATGTRLEVVDVGAGRPTGNIVRAPALDPERFAASWGAGRERVAALDADLLLLGEMGIGNTTAAAAVCAAIFGRGAAHWTGRGTGIDEPGYARKVAAVEAACARLEPALSPLEILRQVGGAELAALAGATFEARMRSLPVVLDGFVVTAAAAPLEAARPGALDHCIAGHLSGEAGHAALLEVLGKQPLLDLGMRLGEGSGALAALPLLRLATAVVTEVATFEELDGEGAP
jgi:nicotinate-nucleotide--dimethylbenzimidazole phosphoribosyltransferase